MKKTNRSIVWSWSRAELIPSPQGVLGPDGLDATKPQDERNGVRLPLAMK